MTEELTLEQRIEADRRAQRHVAALHTVEFIAAREMFENIIRAEARFATETTDA